DRLEQRGALEAGRSARLLSVHVPPSGDRRRVRRDPSHVSGSAPGGDRGSRWAGRTRAPVAPPPLDRCHVRGGLPAKELARAGPPAGRISRVGRLAASILSADFAYLADQVKAVEPHADVIHVDVMDAHFVPPLTIGPVVVESLRPHTELP